MARGQLRIYLGAAPGVGKTYAMLAEAQRRRARGTDVVVGLLETHGRKMTAAMAEGLEIVPRRTMTHRGAIFTEMDLDAVLARHPEVALVDELAHTNVPGCRNPKRWQDVDELLDAGINVISTLNIQHLESLNDVAMQVTGVEQHEKLPDEIARRADQIELVDMTPEALRRRMVHGNVYPPNRVDAALTHYFRPGNLTALRELALLWLADRVEEGLQRYRAEHGIATPWETRERIVVAVAGEQDDQKVIRRAARIAARTPGSDLLAVHVVSDDGLAAGHDAALAAQRALVTSLGGSFRLLPGADVADALLSFARAENATQMVLGASRRSRLLTLIAGKSIPTRLARRAEHIDVHLVSRRGTAERGHWSAQVLTAFHYRKAQAERDSAEAAALTRLAGCVLRGHDDLPALLEEMRQISGLAAVSLLEWRQNGSGRACYVVASAGEQPPEGPGADVELPVSDTFTLAGRGPELSREGSRVLFSCAVQVVAGLSYRRQEDQQAQATRDAANLRSRAALLAATGQTAREQLAAARAALAALAAAEADGPAGLGAALPPAAGPPAARAALLATARRAVDQVTRLVDDLTDLSRLHAGAVETYLQPVDLDEVMAACLDDLGPGSQHITLSMAEDLPDVIADATLLTRILTSLLADALQRSPAGPPPVVTAVSRDSRVEVHITGQGPDQPGAEASLAFRLARDLTEALGDTLRTENFPGGGHSVVVTLPAAAPAAGTLVPVPGDTATCSRLPSDTQTKGRYPLSREAAIEMTHKNERVLSVAELARVEGEGALYVRTSGNKVEEARLDIYEPPRFFEAFLRGRAYTEPPDITARICGICPVAYQMSACLAIEEACGTGVDGPIADLRRLLYCGEWIESHALHIYLLHAPDFLGYSSGIEMATHRRDLVERGLALKKAGNAIMEAVGGRAIHPVNVRLGGFYRAPARAELAALTEPLRRALDVALETVRWVAGFDFPDHACATADLLAMSRPGTYAIERGTLVTRSGLAFPAAGWDEHVIEEHVPHSTALHAHLAGGGRYLTGPLARYTLGSQWLSPLAREAARAAGLGETCDNPFRSIIVRAVETVYAVEEALRLIAAYEPPDPPAIEVRPRAGVGYGVTEAPRGTLCHRYEIAADGLIATARIIPPTSQNQAAIEADLRAFVEARIELDDAELTRQCEQAIRNYDPCISCAAHFLDLTVERSS